MDRYGPTPRERHFAIVTRDADFVEMSALFGSPPKVIWIRGANSPTRLVRQLLNAFEEKILAFGDDASATWIEIRPGA